MFVCVGFVMCVCMCGFCNVFCVGEIIGIVKRMIVCLCVRACDVWGTFGAIVKRMCVYVCVCVCLCDVWGRVGRIVKRMCVCVCVICGKEMMEL